jgi:membrane associated rhomboid family serine protease
LLGIGLVPTIACAAGAEARPNWPQLLLSHADILKHFTYVRDDGRPWTLLTSALCHADAEHRERNALTLLAAGWDPARSLGYVGFALLFFGGHVAALLNNAGHLLQLQRRLEANTYNLLPSWGTNKAARWWISAMPTRIFGASAGGFALLGFDVTRLRASNRQLQPRRAR